MWDFLPKEFQKYVILFIENTLLVLFCICEILFQGWAVFIRTESR